MKVEQLDLIKKISNTIIELGKKNDTIKRYLYMIESAAKAHQLRAVFLKVIKENYQSGKEEPAISLKEYTEFLFPDGQYWGEVRDLMLIYLYERLHEINFEFEENSDSEIAVTEENYTNEM